MENGNPSSPDPSEIEKAISQDGQIGIRRDKTEKGKIFFPIKNLTSKYFFVSINLTFQLLIFVLTEINVFDFMIKEVKVT